MRRIAKSIRSRHLAFELILTSPLRRARETAEIVAEVLASSDLLEVTPHLHSEGDPSSLVREIRKTYGDRQDILLVGHEPSLSRLISILLSGHDKSAVTLKKGGLCKLTTESLAFKRCATLEWLMGPAELLGT
jgi:phosphohistidine phosphatase